MGRSSETNDWGFGARKQKVFSKNAMHETAKGRIKDRIMLRDPAVVERARDKGLEIMRLGTGGVCFFDERPPFSVSI